MASVSGTGGGAGSGSAGDCEGEEQEDPSSSNQTLLETKDQLERLNLDDGKKNIEDELEVFRQQWQRELGSSLSPYKESRSSVKTEVIKDEPLNEEEKAKQLFLLGVELERSGKLYEAIQHYKRAIQILPDVESRLYEDVDARPDSPEEESETEEVGPVDHVEDSEDEEAVEGEDLLARLQRIMARKGYLFEAAHATKSAHITWLPYEVLQLVLRWVVGGQLDAVSLERVAAVCRGLYVAAREPDIWRCVCVNHLESKAKLASKKLEAFNRVRQFITPSQRFILISGPDYPSISYYHLIACNDKPLEPLYHDSPSCRMNVMKTWGIECGTPRAHGYLTWRQMYIERARLNLNGVYISKTRYLRHGETSFQDHFYRPWYLVDYYRYLRFFPEGHVLMWTTADEPAVCVGHLKHRDNKNSLGIQSGHYRLVGDTVVIVIKKACEKRVAQSSTRFRTRRKEQTEPQEHVFHMELELRSVRSRRNAQLSWRRYAVSARRDVWTAFDLAPASYPPFAFSRVRAFTAHADQPLQAAG